MIYWSSRRKEGGVYFRRVATAALPFLLISWIVPRDLAASDLFVGNFFGSTSNVLQYNGTSGAFVSTFVPHGSGGLTFPLGGAFGPDGMFYVSNSDNDTVLRYSGASGAFLNTFAGGVEDSAGLAFGPDKNLYVADSADPGAITKLNGTTGTFISQLTGGGLSDPEGIVFGPDGNLYVANVNNGDVLRFNGVTGAFMEIFVSSGSGGLAGPRDVAFGPDGNLYVTSTGGTGGVLRYNGSTGAFLDAFVKPGSELFLPRELVFGPDANLYVSNFGVGDVVRFSGSTGAFIDDFVPVGSGGLGGPTFLVFHDISSSVPEPSGVGLVGLGLVGTALWKLRQFRVCRSGSSKAAQ